MNAIANQKFISSLGTEVSANVIFCNHSSHLISVCMYISMIMLVGASWPCNVSRYPQRPSPSAPMIFHYHRLYGKPLSSDHYISMRQKLVF